MGRRSAIISVIVYGRNDSYGYNLHKRVALSLNNLASLLRDDSDEIIFVDYNTSRGFPSLPEAIADTLTEDATQKLRILRFTEAQHNSLRIQTHLKVLEPHARNIALRRSLPNNRWVLCTNTDMIFVPRNGKSLTENVAELGDGHYGLPRFELPEGLWETLDRREPQETISQVTRWGVEYSLNNVALSWEPHRFDAPGDFQLMLREDLWRVDGFDERMTLGWHVDSNISRRISMLRGPTKDLSERLLGYHCDHTRQETPMHKAGAPQNSTTKFIDFVSKPGLPGQRNRWGAPDKSVQDFSLDASAGHRLIRALPKSLSGNSDHNQPRRYNSSGFNTDPPADRTVFTFLFDLFVSEPSPPKVAWIGLSKLSASALRDSLGAPDHLATFRGYWDPTVLSKKDFDPVITSDYIILDFRPTTTGNASELTGTPESERQLMVATLRKLWARQQRSVAKVHEPRIIGIDVVNTSADSSFHTYVGAGRTPYVVGFRHGFFNPARRIGLAKILFGSLSRLKSRLRRKLIGEENVASFLARILGLKFARKIYAP